MRYGQQLRHLISAILVLPLVVLLTGQASGQPHTYIIPDIGTPGMNTYVEVISTVDSIGKFLIADGPASPVALTVLFVNPADSLRVRISPPIVSWDSRLLSFQFFVKPRAATGPIPLRIQVSSRLLAIDTFWIVSPTPFGAKTGGGVIGSGGAWGTRSRRGAMIVDSMVLSSGAYTFATTDTDPFSQGNQGLFPTVVMSRGRIVVNAGATLSAAANGKHAGPGGGGGGGFGPSMPGFPFVQGEADAPQGNGFAGGRSSIPTYQSPGPFGAGTGVNAASMNNVAAPAAAGSTRFLAGAPGHPMDRDGRQGGGLTLTGPMSSAYIYNLYAGGGGNVTAGTGLPGAAPAASSGQPIGNQMIVPLHGGAGGASGGSYDSTGGGGGGGVALYSYARVVITTVDASGGNGRNGANPVGKPLSTTGDASGGGSGGCILVGGPLGVQISTALVDGGSSGAKHPTATQPSIAGSGSVGRLRHDGRVTGNIAVTTGATHYTGPTMDTLTYADSVTWTVRGTGRYRPGIGGDSIFVFMRGDNTQWSFVNPYKTVVAADSTWSVRVVFPFDSLAFVYAAQKADTTGTTEYTKIPQYVYSQAAGAVVRLNLIPRLLGPNSRNLDTVACSSPVYDTVRIANAGTGLLIFYPGTTFLGANAGYYSIIRPSSFPDSVLPGDTARIVVRFNASVAPNGDRSVILRLITNDPILQQFDISYRTIREQLNYTLQPRIIDMGGIQLGASHDTSIVFRNRNTYQNLILSIDPVNISGQATYVRLYPLPTVTVRPGDSVVIGFRVIPRDTSQSTAKFVVRSSPCGNIDTIYFRSHGVTGVVDSKKSLLFSRLACGDTALDSVWIHNVGNGPLTIKYPVIIGQDSLRFSIVSPPAATFPRIVAVGDSFLVVVRVGNGGSGTLIGKLQFENSDSLYQKNPYYVDLIADRDAAVLSVADSTVDIGSICVGKPVLIPIDLDNESLRANVSITRIVMADSTGPVRIVFPSSYPFPISAGSSATISIRVTATRPGAYSDTLSIRFQPCNGLLRLYVRFTAYEADLTAAPDPIDFGDVTVTTSAQRTVVLTNSSPTGGGTITIDNLGLRPPNAALRVVWPTFPPTRSLAPGDTMHVIVEYSPTTETLLPTTELFASLTSPCRDTVPFQVTGRGTTSAIGLSRNIVTMAIGPCSPLAPVEDTLTVFNVGTAGVALSNPVIAPGAFTLVSPPGPFSLPPGGRQTIRVRFTPVAAGVVNGTLTYATTDPKRPVLTVTLVGRRDTISIEPSTRRMVFPTILACQTQVVDTLILRNTGTVTTTILPVNTVPAANFQVAIPPPYSIRPGDSMMLPLIFSPSVDGTFQARLVMGIGSCGRIDTIDLEGTRLPLSQSVSNLDFGDVSLGGSGIAGATVTNNNPSAIRVVGARVLPASSEVTINPGQFPIVIPSGLTAQVIGAYAPLIPGPLPAGLRLEVDIDSVCVATMVSDVTGRAVEGGISTSRSAINFGNLLECQMKEDTIFVTNIGIVPVTVSSMSIIPSGSADFTLSGGTLVTPMTLAPGDSETVFVRFAPSAPPDGLRAATLHFITDDPIRPEVDVTLSGNRVSHSAILRGPGFGIVGAGTAARARHWIVNTGTAPILLASLTIPSPFTVVSTAPSLPTTIAPGDSIEVELDFAPTTVGMYVDTLRLALDNACDSLRLAVSAEAIDLTVIVATGSWGNVSGPPGATIRIPFDVNDDLSSIPVTSVTGTLHFNPSAFVPTGVSLQGTIVPGWTVTTFSRSTGQVDFAIGGGAALAGTGTVAFVEGIVALGDSMTSTLWSVDTIRTDSKRASIVLGAGALLLEGVCDIGGNRLVRIDGTFGIKGVRPNPASHSTEIAFETVENGPTALLLLDALGRVVASPFDEDVTPQPHVVSLSLIGLPSGIYYLELRTPTRVERHRLLIAQ